MKPVLIDTDILSLFLRNHPTVVHSFKKYIQEYEKINISIITYYEIVSGLRYKDAHKQLRAFEELVANSNILLATKETMDIAADIYGNLRKQGLLIDDIDILIASIAKSNGLVLVTHNISHFGRIANIEIEDWSTN